MTARCPWQWQVEAARDGRLDQGLRAEFERHLRRCARCGEEQRALEAVAETLRAQASGPDEVALRRMRQTLLGDASRLMQSSSPRTARRWVGGAAGARSTVFGSTLAAAAVFALGLGALRLFAAEQPRRPLIEMRPQAGTKWSRHSTRGIERIDLDDGELHVVVRRTPADPRVVVHVPDGEIEDLGTVFRVRVNDRRTNEIAVSEGQVVFRRQGQAALRLSAGMQWTRVEAERPLAGANRAPSSRASRDAPNPATAPRASARNRARTPPSERSTNASASRATPADREADSAVVRNPSPSPVTSSASGGAAEDAAYLRILALLREGRREEARVAAAAYLQRHPTGFRRLEVERVAWPGDKGRTVQR